MRKILLVIIVLTLISYCTRRTPIERASDSFKAKYGIDRCIIKGRD